MNVRAMALPDLLALARESLPMFTVYERPTEYPQGYLARLFLTLPDVQATNLTIRCEELEGLRDELRTLGLTQLARSPEDETNIVEVWL